MFCAGRVAEEDLKRTMKVPLTFTVIFIAAWYVAIKGGYPFMESKRAYINYGFQRRLAFFA